MNFKIRHDPEIDYVSIDFKDGVEAKSYFKEGVIIREDKKGHVIGIDITNSNKFFHSKETISLQAACRILSVSESTLRRKIRSKEIPCTKPNGKDYRFKKSDVLGLR